MKSLRIFRIVLATLFFAAALAYLLIGPETFALSQMAQRAQIIPSALATTMGVTLFWIVVTLLFGRLYCSTVCPLGSLQDGVIWLHRKVKRGYVFSYRPARPVRYHVLAIYAVCLIVGVVAIPYWLEPWNMMRNICSVINPTAVEATWINLGIGVAAGMASGVVSLILIVGCAWLTGRGFCTAICPIGTALGLCHSHSLYHIEIDPDLCLNCMKCEEVCKSQCVKVAGRYVDNSRCVRCFNCMDVCPNNAIRMQRNRNQRGNPLVRKATNIN